MKKLRTIGDELNFLCIFIMWEGNPVLILGTGRIHRWYTQSWIPWCHR